MSKKSEICFFCGKKVSAKMAHLCGRITIDRLDNYARTILQIGFPRYAVIRTRDCFRKWKVPMAVHIDFDCTRSPIPACSVLSDTFTIELNEPLFINHTVFAYWGVNDELKAVYYSFWTFPGREKG